MKPHDPQRPNAWRRGAFAVIFALFLPILVGMMALTVDIAVISTAQSEMAAAADAAALAGAQQLISDSRMLANPNMAAMITSAQSNATYIATSNPVLGAAPVLVSNPNNLVTGEVVVGYLDPLKNFTSTISTSGLQTDYNAVQVRITRDATHGGVIPAFFSRLEGYNGTSMTATSTALVQNYPAGGFASVNGLSANILPIALYQTTYNAMIAGNPTGSTATGMPMDQYSYDAATGKVSAGSDGIYESCLYPVSNGASGNWGTVQIGVTNNGTSTLAAQIQYGITPQQLSNYPGGVLQLSNLTNPQSLILNANPGISAGIKSNIDAIIGQTRLIPIYSAVTGNGNNTSYTIVKFAGVRVMASNFQGNPKYVVVQPARVTDPTATPLVPTSVPPALPPTPPKWSEGGIVSLQLVR
jgi:Flp pilus assembly protein TadG